MRTEVERVNIGPLRLVGLWRRPETERVDLLRLALRRLFRHRARLRCNLQPRRHLDRLAGVVVARRVRRVRDEAGAGEEGSGGGGGRGHAWRGRIQ